MLENISVLLILLSVIFFIVFLIYKSKYKKRYLKLDKKSKWLIGIAIFCTIGSLVILLGSSAQENESAIFGYFMYGIMANIFYILFFIFKKLKPTSEKVALESKNASMYVCLPHITGLNIPEDTYCVIYVCEDKYEFLANNITFNLSLEKITDVSLKTSTEIQQQYVSSIGGAVGGAMLFGPLGAAIGGRSKVKEIKNFEKFLIFTYLDNNETKYITFSIPQKFMKEALKLINDFQTKHPTVISNTVEL